MNMPNRDPMPQTEGDTFFTGFLCGVGVAGIVSSLFLFFM